MTNYRRNFLSGGSFFFSVNLAEPAPGFSFHPSSPIRRRSTHRFTAPGSEP